MWVAYCNDGGVVDEEDVLNGHGWHVCYQDAAQCVCDGWVQVDEVKLHVAAIYPIHHYLYAEMRCQKRVKVKFCLCSARDTRKKHSR